MNDYLWAFFIWLALSVLAILLVHGGTRKAAPKRDRE
jgi:hypothetical protein